MAQVYVKPGLIVLPEMDEYVLEPVAVQIPIQKKSVKSKLSKLFKKAKLNELSKLFKKAKLNAKYLEHVIPIEKMKSQVYSRLYGFYMVA